MRISQYVSSAIECSRRQADSLIKAHKVTINQQIANFGDEVNENDVVKVEGKLHRLKKNNVYLLLNKPVGITCTTAANITGNIIDYINYPKRIYPIGRLDKATTGLILLSNDGSIVNKLLHEGYDAEKVYVVTVNRVITEAFLNGIRKGVNIYNPRKKAYSQTNPAKVVKLDEHRFKITLTQGLNRQIRRMCRYFQYTVVTLERIEFKHLTLEGLAYGEWRHLTMEEVTLLKVIK